MRIVYVGPFPPPYGGVTVKNKTLYNALQEHLCIERIDTSVETTSRLGLLRKVFRLALANDAKIVLAVSDGSRRLLVRFFHMVSRKRMNRLVLIIMGGSFAKKLENDYGYTKLLSSCGHIFVETQGMKESLLRYGLSNVTIYPNCRVKPEISLVPKVNDGRLSCIFFSQISYEKGADVVLEAAKMLPDVDFTFYGVVKDDYSSQFHPLVSESENVSYMGVFSGDNEAVYNVLNSYDVLILPTRWKNEGVPGVLVESKISAIPAIVSDVGFNSEIITSSLDGIVLDTISPSELVRGIELYNNDRALLYRHKKAALVSSEKYLLENNIQNIRSILKDG